MRLAMCGCEFGEEFEGCDWLCAVASVAVASLDTGIRDAIGYVAVASVTGLMRYRLEVKGGCERSATLRRTRASQS